MGFAVIAVAALWARGLGVMGKWGCAVGGFSYLGE